MKFNCNALGDYLKARRREKIIRQQDWHDYFAIIPRKLAHGDCRWLETIERRVDYYYVYGSQSRYPHYRAKART